MLSALQKGFIQVCKVHTALVVEDVMNHFTHSFNVFITPSKRIISILFRIINRDLHC